MAANNPRPSADPLATKALCDYLIAAFEAFADKTAAESEAGLSYIDAVMGCHNFYKTVLLDIERRTGSQLVRTMAVDTLIQGLGLGGNYTHK